jgi:hypothetical protein
VKKECIHKPELASLKNEYVRKKFSKLTGIFKCAKCGKYLEAEYTFNANHSALTPVFKEKVDFNQ